MVFLVFWGYYLITKHSFSPQWQFMWLLPFLIVLMAGLGLGFGILISSLTTKYRDLIFLIGFGVQLMMYASPIVYPLSIVPEKYKWYILINPVSSVIESFKFIFLGAGYFSFQALLYSFVFMMVLLFFSLLIFNKIERNFMDVV
jgi:lipopolysaccharide transport system permease protein